MKAVVISLPYGLAFRNLVGGGVIRAICEQGFLPVVLLPDTAGPDRDILQRQLPPGTRVEHLHRVDPSVRLNLLKLIKQDFYNRRTALDSFQIKRRALRRDRPWFHLAAAAVERLACRFMSEEQVDGLLQAATQPWEREYVRLFQEVGAAAVVISKPGFHPDELGLIRAARQLRLPVVTADTTWDNIVSKRPAYLLPDIMTVWNHQMRRDAVSYYRVASNGAPVTGASQFDIFFDRDRLPNRDVFLKQLELDPARPLIVFTLNSHLLTPNAGFIRLLTSAVASGAVHGRPNVIIRQHPWDNRSDYRSAVADPSSMRLERAFRPPLEGSRYEGIPMPGDLLHYGALMTHADVVINIASTASLDAIAADTPVINIAFDAEPVHPDLSVARYCAFTHYKSVLATGAVALVWTAEELVEEINAALRHRDKGREARQRARREFLTFDDGLSASRIAGVVGGVC